jgi:hypothetical protein
VDNQLFVVDGPVASSSGVVAGIDLALHLIAVACGEAPAAGIAASMVVYLRRSAHDPKLSPIAGHRRHTHAAVHRVRDAINAEPQRDWDMAALACIGHITERHLLRVFLEHAGASPMQCLPTIPLERAWNKHGGITSRRAARRSVDHTQGGFGPIRVTLTPIRQHDHWHDWLGLSFAPALMWVDCSQPLRPVD